MHKQADDTRNSMINLNSLSSRRRLLGALVIGACAIVPLAATVFEEPYYINLFARLMIWAIAAISLNLILGYGGMISLGHALYLGIGAYVVGICAYYGINSAFIQISTAIGAAVLVSLIFGGISLRTRGVYFIMITMALTQMVYFLSISIEKFGSDDGLIIYDRSDFGTDLLNLDNPFHRYYLIFVVMIACLYFSHRLIQSRFGYVIRGAKSNETRMEVLGFSTFRYRLVCFIIAGVMCTLAGVLSANVEKFVSPDVMHWTRSGELIFMVVLGGMASILGPLTGALVFWLLSEVLSRITEHWHIIFGPFLILVVLLSPRGIDGLLALKRSSSE